MYNRLRVLGVALAACAAVAVVPGSASAAEFYANGQALPDNTQIYGTMTSGQFVLNNPISQRITCTSSTTGMKLTHESAIPHHLLQGHLTSFNAPSTGPRGGR